MEEVKEEKNKRRDTGGTGKGRGRSEEGRENRQETGNEGEGREGEKGGRQPLITQFLFSPPPPKEGLRCLARL